MTENVKAHIPRTVLWIAAALCGCVAVSQPLKRIYVEPFTTKAGSKKLQAAVTAELRKLPGVSLVSSAAAADVTLGGGGEIWVKGYRSLNPRSGRLPSDGTPIYAGYLSVELRSPSGETLWSYLAMPDPAADDVSKGLARAIVKHIPEALEQGATTPRNASPSQSPASLRGAGATFPFPVYAKWLTNYRRENPRVEIAYDPIGSEAGIRQLLSGTIDFGASDNPEAIRQLAPGDGPNYLLFPSVVGAVVPIVNLPGFSGEIAFTPEALAGIYLGKIRKWNDPILRQTNRTVRLPDLDIAVVHRADGSGTSYAWTDFLAKAVPEWKAAIGSGFAPKWPIGREALGNEGVAGVVKEIGGSIGYVEYIYALQHHLNFGKVRNPAGEFVAAGLESIAAAVEQGAAIPNDFKISLVNAPGAGAYPIASFTWLVVPSHTADSAKRDAMAGFLRWMLGPGQRQAAALGYLPLPQPLVRREEAAIGKIH